MEEMPSFTPEDRQDSNQEDDLVVRRQLFSETWRRFRNRVENSDFEQVTAIDFFEEEENAKREKDKDDDDEDELLDDDTSSTKKYGKSKWRRFVRSEGRSRKDRVEGQQSDSRPVSDNMTETDVDRDLDGIVDHDQPIQLVADREDADANDTNSEPNEQIDNEQENSLDDQGRPSHIASVIESRRLDRTRTPEPNQNQSSETAYYAVYSGSSGGYTPGSANGSGEVRTVRTSEVSHSHNRLIALDILNYGLALRRDNKNRRLSDRKMKRLSEEVKKQFQANESILYSKKSANNISETVIYNNKTEARVSAERPETASNLVEIITTKNIENGASKSDNNQSIPDIFKSPEKNREFNRPKFDKERMLDAQQKRQSEIPVEFRNPEVERLRTEYAKLLQENVSSSRFAGDNSANSHRPSSVPVDIPVKSPSGTPLSSQKSEGADGYRQLVVPSISGIIAGIIAFLILYILTRG